ncbi:substrate-binding domain-containing protein [Klebsiella pneumoniae]|uniref:substrate-binding domain-containing protein n=1 Tax=Klebsiella pneumoniae TaxID=573 RepID=UPI003D70E95A
MAGDPGWLRSEAGDRPARQLGCAERLRRRAADAARTPNFSAVLVGNDQMALGVLSAFHQHQVAVPGEKSVIGYDDTYESSFFYPALSTVSLDLDLQGKEAVRRILASTSGAPHTSSILPARLVIRHSSGARIEQGKDLQAIAEQLRAIAHRLAP